MTRFGISLASIIAICGLVTIILLQSRMAALSEEQAQLGRANPAAQFAMAASTDGEVDSGTVLIDN